MRCVAGCLKHSSVSGGPRLLSTVLTSECRENVCEAAGSTALPPEMQPSIRPTLTLITISVLHLSLPYPLFNGNREELFDIESRKGNITVLWNSQPNSQTTNN